MEKEIDIMPISKFRILMNQSINISNLKNGTDFKFNQNAVEDQDFELKEQYRELKRKGLI